MSERAGSTIVEVQGSHAVYVSKPQAVADLIKKGSAQRCDEIARQNRRRQSFMRTAGACRRRYRGRWVWLIVSVSHGKRASLFPVSVRDLSHEDGEWHCECFIDRACIRPAVILEDFHAQRCIIGQDHSRLLHPHQSGLMFGLAKSPTRVHRHVRLVTFSDRSDRREGSADLQRHTGEYQFLSASSLYRGSHFGIIPGVY